MTKPTDHRVTIDTEAANDIFAEFPALTLAAVGFAEPWNGFPVPVTTAAEFSRFVAAWADNDPNGAWNGTVTEGDGALIFTDTEGTIDRWTVVGVTDDGVPLYALDGWTWVAR